MAAAVGAAAIFSFAAPWAAARDVAIAESDWRGDRAGAFALLGQAARFNPLDDQAYVTKGVIAARSGEDRTAVDSFEHALGRNSLNWFAWLELALADARLGDHAGAVRAIGKAEELDPRDSVVRLASGALARGRPIPERRHHRLRRQADPARRSVRQSDRAARTAARMKLELTGGESPSVRCAWTASLRKAG